MFCSSAVCQLRVFYEVGREQELLEVKPPDAVSSSSSSQSAALVLSDSEGYKRTPGELYNNFCLQDVTAVQIVAV